MANFGYNENSGYVATWGYGSPQSLMTGGLTLRNRVWGKTTDALLLSVQFLDFLYVSQLFILSNRLWGRAFWIYKIASRVWSKETDTLQIISRITTRAGETDDENISKGA